MIAHNYHRQADYVVALCGTFVHYLFMLAKELSYEEIFC